MTSRGFKATARTSPEGRAVARTQTLVKGTNGIGTVRRTTLPGGLRIVTETLPSVRSATFGIWAHVGSRDETRSLGGATHYLEHLLFKGTARRSALDISAALDAVGGEMNAFTAKEYTCYYARVLDTDLPLAIDVVCDMLTGSLIREEDVDVERGAILEEIAMTEDDPGDCVHDLFAHTMFGDTPLGRPVLGTVETVNALTADRIRRFYKKHYDPTHLVVACAGNIDHAKVVRQVRAAFERAGALKNADAVPLAPRNGRRVVRTAGRVELLGRKTEQAHLVLGMPGLARTDERRWALGVLNTALGGGMSSRLFQEIREKRGLAYSVYSYTSGFADCGLFGVYAGCRPSQVHDVLRICRDELDRVAENGLSDDEIRRAVGQLQGSTVLGLEDTGALMNRIGKSELCWGEQISVDDMLARMAAVTPDEVREVARDVLGQRPSLSVIGPLKDKQAAGLHAAVS
ncbi:insulinase family protein [Streptomyces thermoviolaceus]|uniref:Insulinase family protein n=2 Tax=Streptomyces TaxID=1883 RepID=A0ABX0YWC2_STRTL|nr:MULTISPECIES: pitrilysin family protein [Streptomyces]MCM3264587.1 insulinase family protein [Streptomyces thermoviolaceus]NJP16856.1 insulinase family protein [Streptomyces thermoviolaceus subsp. thermoviolaceus]RSR97106.1 insulinase family protein [Streptomyces sp. WAC00469]WTD47131.1 insulinase family protein [Streptomyces thermoviolaceus]GGV83772.1 putative zinc protease [Streptomyces thermoviolaceus subsp. apingens]